MADGVKQHFVQNNFLLHGEVCGGFREKFINIFMPRIFWSLILI
jgi:hypothetical protein